MNPDETKSDQPTPEELLRELDVELAKQRKRKQHAPARRAIILTVGILLIMGGLLASLLILRQMADDLPRPPRKKPVATPK